MALRDEWKQTGKDLGHAFEGLGKAIVRSVRVGVDKADDWASNDVCPSSDSSETKETKQAEPIDGE